LIITIDQAVRDPYSNVLLGLLVIAVWTRSGQQAYAEEARPQTATAPSVLPAKTLADALPPEKWQQVQDSVDRALAYLASQQAPDGSFPTYHSGQPAVTSLCVMAFLARGHRPGFGPYGAQLNRAIDFVLSCQKDDGLLCDENPESDYQIKQASHAATYSHAIAGLMLGEVYGHVTGKRAKEVKAAIAKAIIYTRNLQSIPKPQPDQVGGLRYVRTADSSCESDLSVTAWHLMFLRSAKNAEFNVPKQYMEDAIGFVRRCWSQDEGTFKYRIDSDAMGRGMAGAGIVSLAMAGEHNSSMALAAGNYLIAHPYHSIRESISGRDRFFYSTYYCSQAAAQLGGRYWEKIFPPMVDVFLSVQAADGSFPPEPLWGDHIFGSRYTTAIAVLALTPAYQLLPVYQR
jgi:hypothetical protein